MKPVNINAFDMIGEMVAASKIAFGAAVAYAAAGTVKAAIDIATSQNILGIVNEDAVEKDEDGFYSQYDVVPIITAGRCRVWVTPTHTTAENIAAGAYLEIADLGASQSQPLGVFQQMGAEDGSATPTVREAETLARALEDVTLIDPKQVVTGCAINGTTVILSEVNITALGLAVGDYFLLENADGDAMINRVKAITTTTITLQIASTVLIEDATDYVHKLMQCEVMLL